jgi:hypothetical protein
MSADIKLPLRPWGPDVNRAVSLSRPVLRLFAIFCIAVSLFICVSKPQFRGDAAEYTLMTVAIAQHGSADITPSDVALARQVFPYFSWHQDAIAGYLSGTGALPPGFLKGVDGKVHAIHFFGYSAVAAIPYKFAEIIGKNPYRCFLWVDGLALFLVAYSAWLYFGTAGRALAAVAVLMMSVGLPYWNWASPELYSTALSLAALMLMARSRHIVAGCLLGLAGMQNPPLLSLLFVGPVIAWADALMHEGAGSVRQFVRDIHWRQLVPGTLLGLAIGLSPIYFSYRFFDTWNVIAAGATDHRLVTALRLVSYYFDINQGMAIAIPGVWLVLGLMIIGNRKLGLLFIPVMLSSLILAIPTLSTQNWNSGASGFMRYVVWGSVPFIFLLLAYIRHCRQLPKWFAALFISMQALSVANAKTYSHIEFSPLANWVLRHAPQYYNPEPEIFVDRSSGAEPMMDFDQAYVGRFGDQIKTLYYAGSLKSIAAVCPQGLPTARSVVKASYDGWTYLNGPVECGAPVALQSFDMHDFERSQGGHVADGWSRFEFGNDGNGGIWSLGKQSTFVVTLPPGKPDAITIRGVYLGGNWSTEVAINGKPAGTWHLDRPNRIGLDLIDQGNAGQPNQLEVTLTHKSPKAPSAQDTRELAFFMKQVVLSFVAAE